MINYDLTRKTQSTIHLILSLFLLNVRGVFSNYKISVFDFVQKYMY